MEQWRDIENYEGLYQVSSEGRVKSLNFNRTGEERIRKLRENDRGYLHVILCKDGNMKYHLVHRLVAQAFIDNPDNLPQVNHKDENPSNNNVENLEWCTNEYNHNYGTRNKRAGEANTNGKCSISIDMLTKDDEFIRQFPSGMEAMRWLRENGFPSASLGNINMCCKGYKRYSHAYGFKWRYSLKGN